MTSKLTRARLEKIKSWRETYGAGSNVMLPAEEAEDLARIALAAMDSEPVMYCMEGNGLDPEAVSTRREVVEAWVNEWNAEDRSLGEPIYSTVPLYRHAQPAPISAEPVTVTDDMAYAFHHALTDGPIGADDVDEIKAGLRAAFANVSAPQPAPVVPDEWTIVDAVKFCREPGRQDAGAAMDAWNACRAAMLQAGDAVRDLSKPVDPQVAEYEQNVLQAGNSPVIPDGYMMVPKEPTQAHLNSIAMRYRHDFYLLNDAQKDSALATARQMYEECSGQGFYTLPAAPQEVK